MAPPVYIPITTFPPVWKCQFFHTDDLILNDLYMFAFAFLCLQDRLKDFVSYLYFLLVWVNCLYPLPIFLLRNFLINWFFIKTLMLLLNVTDVFPLVFQLPNNLVYYLKIHVVECIFFYVLVLCLKFFLQSLHSNMVGFFVFAFTFM